MDSNNFMGNVGVGEREGRVFSSLIRSRHFSLAHGIGRSGDVSEVQPKAAGSSLLTTITRHMARHALSIAGFKKVKDVVVLPMCTGMSLTLVLLSILPQDRSKKVLWCRCDQKSCLKAIQTAGFDVCVIEGKIVGDEVVTDLEALKGSIEKYGPASIAAVITTTSCFAPRAPDRVIEVAQLCKTHEIIHIINNAYGVQSRRTMATINQAHSQGRVDVTIQSTDKNFMVPVGGCVIASGMDGVIDRIAKSYPGRASSSPVVDLFITLLSMGKEGFEKLLNQREVRNITHTHMCSHTHCHTLSLIHAHLRTFTHIRTYMNDFFFAGKLCVVQI
eukprot:c7372_g1_i1.p1 GENE.c7372_g1_i1~~c7372_g1_i1.p1  ORF type:complete len:388 (-),score=72.85 c7372_g1_i1:360-1352(-)